MTKTQIYFVSGVCGAGKSSVIPYLKKMLPPESYDVRDFDERGVPSGGGREWHDNETRHWLEVATANSAKGVITIVCGFANPDRFKVVHMPTDPVAQLILLDASPDTIRQRLRTRHATPESIQEICRASGVSLEDFIENNATFAPELHAIFEREGGTVINVDVLTPEEVASEVAELVDRG